MEDIQVALLITGIVVPPVILFCRFLWKQTKCIILTKARLEQLENHDTASNDEHNDLWTRLTTLETDHARTDAKLDLLLKHFNLKI